MRSWHVGLKVFTQVPGWHTVHKTCDLVTNGNSLDAEIWGCAVLVFDWGRIPVWAMTKMASIGIFRNGYFWVG